MSQPLLYVSPDDGQVYKVRESELVSLEGIDERIAHHQNAINELNTERVKFLEITAEQNSASGNDQSTSEEAQPEQPAEPTAPAQPETPAAPEAPAAPAEQAPADSAPAAPAEQPAQPADPASDPTVGEDITASTGTDQGSSEQPATPPIAA